MDKDVPGTPTDNIREPVDGEEADHGVLVASERENTYRESAGYGIREALIKDAAAEIEKRVLKIHQEDRDELKAYFDAELVNKKKELVSMLAECFKEAVYGINRHPSEIGECSKCLADSSSTKVK